MTAHTMQIGNRPCRIYGEAHAEYLLLQMTGEHELQSMDHEVAAIAQSNRKYLFVAIPVESWNDALSPWEAPAVWGKESFGCNAADTLRFLMEQVIPTLKQRFALPETKQSGMRRRHHRTDQSGWMPTMQTIPPASRDRKSVV